MKYVIGIDLGTSAVKVLLVNQEGTVCFEVSKEYPLIQLQSGFSEQDPEEWVKQTISALKDLVNRAGVSAEDIEGISYSGQMHGLVLLDARNQVLRNAILWNDTRTTKQCKQITDTLGEKLITITKNIPLEGFTLPKLLWVKENEPDLFGKAVTLLLPKDYLRFRMTGSLAMDYSDAAGTLLLDVSSGAWSTEICEMLDIPITLCPPLVDSFDMVGTLLPGVAREIGLSGSTKVFAGGADNACGAIGAGILSDGDTMCSIGTSGVVLSYEDNKNREFHGKVHFFNHAKGSAYYTMGVTLAAGFSLSWFKSTFANEESYENLLSDLGKSPVGARGLIFTPYLVGERTPHADAMIRGSFVGIDANHQRADFTRAVIEGITFSLQESIEIFRRERKEIHRIISIGGGAKSDDWLQIQADIFNATVLKLENEQGPGMGAAMLAAYGCGWFDSLEACAQEFTRVIKEFQPNKENVGQYEELYSVYKEIYPATQSVSTELYKFRNSKSN
ncbi:xylulokinase [Alicyclobacillus ferrooxydans]|uniref:Xylulose kinase n=1 Tax=Alicyclobacillus ferrooxydans TaxID=471514 RepID=A0A0P9EES2_9BACL|nr:xylulokinase [Alicyclobacillus ferrooxydans]KPV40836.1 xylulose kinase [Alicyclobacillus ferrooxydans]